MRENMMDTAGQGFDWAGGGASAFHVDGFTLDTILLIANAKCCFNCSVEGGQGGIIGDDVVLCITKGDVVNEKCLSLAATWLFGVLPNPQQVVKGNIAKVSNGLVLGFV